MTQHCSNGCGVVGEKTTALCPSRLYTNYSNKLRRRGGGNVTGGGGSTRRPTGPDPYRGNRNMIRMAPTSVYKQRSLKDRYLQDTQI